MNFYPTNSTVDMASALKRKLLSISDWKFKAFTSSFSALFVVVWNMKGRGLVVNYIDDRSSNPINDRVMFNDRFLDRGEVRRKQAPYFFYSRAL